MTQQEIDTIHFKLSHAVTAYDIKQSTKRGYNRYALPQYLGAVQNACNSLTFEGVTVRMVCYENFCGRLLDVCLKAVGEPKSTTTEEHRGGRVVRVTR